jgi:hypothetical protein
MLEGRCLPSTVMNLLDSGPGSLRQAIIDTPSGGTVDFQAGLTGTITLTSATLTIGKNLTITGPGASVITVSGNGLEVFSIGSFTVAISGLTIARGASPGGGGGVLNAGTLTISNCTVSDNQATFGSRGGGIYNNGGNLTVSNSTLSGNSASGTGGGGGIYSAGGTLTVSNSTLSGNGADEGGGIRTLFGTVTVSNSTLSGNTAIQVGGGRAAASTTAAPR